MDGDMTAPAVAPRCQVWPMVLAGMVLLVWGTYVLMTRYQGETVGLDVMASGPTAAVALVTALMKASPRRGGAS